MTETFFDIVDEHDNLTGRTASYTEVHKHGLWHRGVHVILYTPDGQIVMQKRSLSLAIHPGEIEVSVGGGVDAGETPEQAIRREIQEELNLTIAPQALRFIGKLKYNHPSPHHSGRYYAYCYAAPVDPAALDIAFHNDEVSQIFLISRRRLRRALRLHRIKGFGRISSTYARWRYLLDAI